MVLLWFQKTALAFYLLKGSQVSENSMWARDGLKRAFQSEFLCNDKYAFTLIYLIVWENFDVFGGMQSKMWCTQIWNSNSLEIFSFSFGSDLSSIKLNLAVEFVS